MGINPDTKRMVEDWMRGSADALVQSGNNLDTKMVGVMAGGSVVIGVASTVFGSTREAGVDESLSTAAMICAVVSYLILLATAFACLLPSNFRRPLTPKVLQEYLEFSPDEVRRVHHTFVLKCYDLNREIVRKKVKYLRCALILLGVETISIILWMTAQFFNR